MLCSVPESKLTPSLFISMQALLTRFSYRASMVALALGFGVLGALCLPFIKPRVPVAPRGSVEAARARRVDTAFLKRTPFYAFGASILFSSLGNFIPSVWIPCELFVVIEGRCDDVCRRVG